MGIVNLKRKAEDRSVGFLDRAEKRKKGLRERFGNEDARWEGRSWEVRENLKRKRGAEEMENGTGLFTVLYGEQVECVDEEHSMAKRRKRMALEDGLGGTAHFDTSMVMGMSTEGNLPSSPSMSVDFKPTGLATPRDYEVVQLRTPTSMAEEVSRNLMDSPSPSPYNQADAASQHRFGQSRLLQTPVSMSADIPHQVAVPTQANRHLTPESPSTKPNFQSPNQQEITLPLTHLRITTHSGKATRWSSSLSPTQSNTMWLQVSRSSPFHISNLQGLEWYIELSSISALEYSRQTALVHIIYSQGSVAGERDWWIAFRERRDLDMFLYALLERREELSRVRVVEVSNLTNPQIPAADLARY